MEVLYGDVSPSGHLPYTIPKAEEEYASSVSLVCNSPQIVWIRLR